MMDLAMSGWTSYNGLTNTITYDSDLRPTSITVPGVENLSFGYDKADRLTAITNGMDSTKERCQRQFPQPPLLLQQRYAFDLTDLCVNLPAQAPASRYVRGASPCAGARVSRAAARVGRGGASRSRRRHAVRMQRRTVRDVQL
jgi:YD repeat-containing protein